MRVEMLAKDVRPGDMVWFGGSRKPSRVESALVQEGAETLMVLRNDSSMWYLPFNTGKVWKYEEDAPEEEVEEQVFLDPDGNPA